MPFDSSELLPHEGWIRSLASQLVTDSNEADDLVQSTWLAALGSGKVRQPRAWLAQVARNTARGHWRGRRELVEERSDAPSRGNAPSTLEEVAQDDMRKQLLQALESMEEPYRSALKMRFYEDRSSVEIAEALSVPEGTVRWRQMRGLELLRADLDRRCQGDRSRWLGLLGAWLGRSNGRTALGAGAWWLPALGLALAIAGAALGWSALRSSGPDALPTPQRSSQAPPQRLSTPSAEISPVPAGLERQASAQSTTSAPSLPEAQDADALTPAPDPARNASLPVRVLDPEGLPVPGAQVLVIAGDAWSARGLSADDGSLDLPFGPRDRQGMGTGRSQGMLSLQATGPGWTHSYVQHLAEPFLGSGQVLEMRLRPGAGSIAGQVQDANGQGLAHARLFALAPGRVGHKELAPGRILATAPSAVRADESGHFRFEGLPAGGLTLYVQAESYPVHAQEIQVQAGETLSLNPKPRQGAGASGQVQDPDGQPVAGARVWFEPSLRGHPFACEALPGFDQELLGFCQEVLADEGGFFSLQGIPSGPARLYAKDPARPGLLAWSEHDLAPGQLLDLDLLLKPSPSLELRVRDAQGQPITDASVLLTSEVPGGPAWARFRPLDSDGSLRLLDCVPEQVEIHVTEPNYDGPIALQVAGARRRDSPLNLQAQDVPLRRLQGSLAWPAGREPRSTWAVLMSVPGQVKRRSPLTDERLFELDVPAGRHHIELRVEGLGIVDLGVNDLSSADLVGLDRTLPGLTRLQPKLPAAETGGPWSHELVALSKVPVEFRIRQGAGLPTDPIDVLPGRYLYRVSAPDGSQQEATIEALPGVDVAFDALPPSEQR